MTKKICKSCGEFKGPMDIAPTSNICDKCHSKASYKCQVRRKQKAFKKRFELGDPSLLYCSCGNYFVWKYFTGSSMTPQYRSKCPSCEKKEVAVESQNVPSTI